MLIRDCYPVIVTPQLFACRDFYSTFFGLEVGFESSWFIWMSGGENGVASLAFMHPDHPSAPPGPETFNGQGMCLEFQVDDASAEYTRMVEMDAPIKLALRDEDFGQRRFGLSDPAGVWIDVIQQIESATNFWERYAVEP